MIKAFDVIIVGELNADLILSGDVQPTFGQVEKIIAGANLTLGSSSAIFACGAAQLGLRVAMIGKVGDDVFGHFVLSELAARSVDTRAIIIDSAINTGLSVIFSKKTDRAILTYRGSIPMLHYNEIDQTLLAQARHLHFASYFLLDALRPDVPHLLDVTQSLGLTTSLDTNYDPSETWDGGLADALARTDIFLPNENELCAIAHTDKWKALEIIANQVPTVVVKCGASGAIARQGNHTTQVNAMPVDVVDTTGAGDSFDAGFVYAYLNGWELDRALHFACACGSLSTRAIGGIAAQPKVEQVLEYL
jgi:sugar/nucleoside kinase (ribokinase family)